MHQKRSLHPGIEVRHGRSCATKDGEKCDCEPGYQACIFNRRDRRKIKKTFKSLAAAKIWQQDSKVAVRKGTMMTPTKLTVDQAAEAWVKGAKEGTIRSRSGDPFKPS